MSTSIKYSVFFISILSTLLTACGGSGDSSNSPTTSSPVATLDNTPTKLTTRNWTSAKIISLSLNSKVTLETIGQKLLIRINSINVKTNEHLQLYIDTDNNPDTGFQFTKGEAWAQSGADTLIEDGDLYKSLSNDWEWNMLDPIGYNASANDINIEINLSKLGKICNTLNMGLMIRDENWNATSFQPAATKMKKYTVSYCNTHPQDTTPPVITLSGDNPMTLEVNSTFNDPGATAIDNIDGNITAKIQALSTVNTSIAGNYFVDYSVTDIAGNSTTEKRIVNVTTTPQTGIIIDGNASDWASIPIHASSSNGVLKIIDTADIIYIMVNADQLGENTQLFLDIDNNLSSGLDLSQHTDFWQAGADYMIENDYLVKSTANSAAWSWQYITWLNYAKSSNVLEVAINKSDINQLQNTIKIGYFSRNQNWNTRYILPDNQQIPLYNLQFPVAVNPVTAIDDMTTATASQPVNIDVLANDTTTNGSVLSVDSVSPPLHGTALITQNKITYTANAGFTGTEAFNYQISDTQGHQATAKITVTVSAPANQAPIANNDTSTTAYAQAVNIDVLANDTDADNDTLVISSVSNPQHGTAVIQSGKILYTPPANFSGTVTFNYTISDGNNGSATATVSVTITQQPNRPPVANADTSNTAYGQTVNILVLANDTDPDNDSLTISSASNPQHGTAVIHVNNSINYTPAANYSGTDTFTYTISDGKNGSATATVTVNIAPQPNRAPVAVADSATTTGTQVVTIMALANDTDADGDNLTMTGFTPPAKGTVIYTVAGGFKYTANAGTSGVDSFTYNISDGKGGTATGIITITVAPGVNHAPDAVEDTADVDFDKTITLNVLANDTDPDGDTLTVTSIVQPPFGVAVLNTNGTIFFNPQNNVGSITVIYTISDGRGGTDSATVTFASTNPNSSNDNWPELVNDNVTTTQNTAILIDVIANDSDADGDTIILDQVDQGEHGTTTKVNGKVLYTPDPGYTGTDFFYYGAHDGHGHGGSALVTLTIQ